MAMQPGRRVGPFDIEKLLGSGAMGAVFRARYRKTGQRVAIKVMIPGMGINETALARFEREAEVLKQLNHPNIVRFYIASQYQGAPYYAMEYIEGEPFDRMLSRRGRLTWEEMVDYGKQICAALQHAHDQGIVHRDLKPSNLMIMPDGTVKLTDFGIAKDLDVTQLTGANCTVGTAAYMSPEQCKGEKSLTFKSDLYSLGVVLYELLTGKKPYQAETTMDMFLQHVQGAFERPSRIVLETPMWLDTLICQLLEKKPEHRPYDASTVSRALDEVAEKVATLKSAGVEVATARHVDRRPGKLRVDDTDKHAARTLLDSMGRKKRKRRTRPVYERAWFHGAGLLVLLVGIGAMLYQVFRPPDAGKLHERAEKQAHNMSQKDGLEEAQQVRRQGPIADYLHYYGDREDKPSAQVRNWADEADVNALDYSVQNKPTRLIEGPEGAPEAAANAKKSEEDGEPSSAGKAWKSLEKYAQESDPDIRKWGFLAEKRLAAIAQADEWEKPLPQARAPYKPAPERDNLREAMQELYRAADAEAFGDRRLAHKRWLDLARKYAKEADIYPMNRAQRAMAILAARKARDLKDRSERFDDKELASLLQTRLAEAEKVEPHDRRDARSRYREIVALYKDEKWDDKSDIASLLTVAQKRLDQLARTGAEPGDRR
jgi:serine/threonine-protein kinase